MKSMSFTWKDFWLMGEIRSSLCKEFTSKLPKSADFLFFLCLLLEINHSVERSAIYQTIENMLKTYNFGSYDLKDLSDACFLPGDFNLKKNYIQILFFKLTITKYPTHYQKNETWAKYKHFEYALNTSNTSLLERKIEEKILT